MKNAFFFTQRVAEEICFSWFLLALRLLFGGLLLMHGIMKIIDFDVLSVSFPDPIGIGSTYSLDGLALLNASSNLFLSFT